MSAPFILGVAFLVGDETCEETINGTTTVDDLCTPTAVPIVGAVIMVVVVTIALTFVMAYNLSLIHI